MMDLFHARNVMPQEEIKAGRKRAAVQMQVILRIFDDSPKLGFTPPEIESELIRRGYVSPIDRMKCKWPLTSIRRTITTLTGPPWGLLIKNQRVQRPGSFKVSNCTWSRSPKPKQTELFK